MVLAIAVAFVAAAVDAAPQFPALTGRVVDEVGLLSASARAQLAQLSEQHERATSNQLVIAVVKSLQGYPIEDYGYQLGRHWGIGQKGTNNGVILIVAPNEREVRIEVGYGLEGALTDALASSIIQTEIIPNFKRGEFETGIVAGAQAIAAAIAGEYTPKDARAERSVSGDSLPLPVLIILGVVVGQVLALMMSRVFAGALTGVIAGAALWLFTGTILSSLFAGFLIFLFIAMSSRGGFGGPGMGRMGGMGRGGWGGGGFSGGGGSFGGGGASGRW
jgi:uncharacterized protein